MDKPAWENMVNSPEYDRLCKKIEDAQKAAEHHAMKRYEMAKCVALCIKKSIEILGYKLKDSFKLTGTGQAAFLSYWFLAYGMDHPPEEIMMENFEDILVALGELEKEEN